MFCVHSFVNLGGASRVLKNIPMGISSNDECENELRKATKQPKNNDPGSSDCSVKRPGRRILGQRFNLHSSFLCAGGCGQDTCNGDGGSPLVCPSKEITENGDPARYYQVDR